jgi:MYXO-CTERM domain-containing protein
MTSTDPPVAGNGDEDRRTGSNTARDEPGDRVGQLRGAGVSVDARRVGQVATGIVLVTLAVLAIVFTIVGIHTNQQDDRLHHDGVPVTFTVTGCLGLLGGSGSNAAGYSCRGTYTLDGNRYSGVQLPGDTFHRPGSTVAAVAVPGDPALVSPASIVTTEHSSAGAFVLPVVLAALLLVLVALLLLLRRRHRAAGSVTAPDAR